MRLIKKILWEDYKDPLEKLKHLEPEQLEFASQFEEFEDHSHNDNKLLYFPQLGFVSIDNYESILQDSITKTCHTNFDITPYIIKQLMYLPGIEHLNPITRYRMVVGFGPLFDINKVRNEIERIICKPDEITEDLSQPVNIVLNDNDKMSIQEAVSDLNNYWLIYIAPNKNTNAKEFEEIGEEYFNLLDTFKQAKNTVGGAIITSWDLKTK